MSVKTLASSAHLFGKAFSAGKKVVATGKKAVASTKKKSVKNSDGIKSEEGTAYNFNVNIANLFNEDNLQNGVRMLGLAGGTISGALLCRSVLTGVGYALGGPALGVVLFSIGQPAGAVGGYVISKHISNKFIPRSYVNLGDRVIKDATIVKRKVNVVDNTPKDDEPIEEQ